VRSGEYHDMWSRGGTTPKDGGGVGISEFGSLGVSTPHLVMLLFGSFLVYTVAIFVVIPHSFVTLHHHELVRPRLGRDFPQGVLVERVPLWLQVLLDEMNEWDQPVHRE